MKAVLSNRIYMECTPEYQKWLNDELTYIIPSFNPTDAPLVIKNMARIKSNLVTIPIGRVDLIPEDYDIVDRRIINKAEFPEFKATLRDSQQAVHDIVDDNVMINAWVSWGKTYTALAIAKKLGQKTLVVTHTIPLRNQWAKQVKEVFGIAPSLIGGGLLNLEGPIVIGNIQTLYRNIPEIQKEFGTIILDEMHHVSAQTFSRVIDTNYARYKIGLSGTLERKDGKHVVFRDYFGNSIIKPPKENYMIPNVDIINSPIRFMDGSKNPWANRITQLTNNGEYRHLITMLAAAYAAKGHKVLVVSDRVSFLKNCAELYGERAVCVVGEVSEENRELYQSQILSGEKDSLWGTLSIYKEGMSVDNLSCLIIATMINNMPMLEQLIGRVLRKYPGKITPVIVDVHLKGKTATRQASLRMGYYLQQGYKLRSL